MNRKIYPCDESKEWYDWEARTWDEYKLLRHRQYQEDNPEWYIKTAQEAFWADQED